MRSSNRSSNIEHESRRNDYHYHHSSRSQQSHSESNGHGGGATASSEYRSTKRSSTATTNSTSLIKRMKSNSNSFSPTKINSKDVNSLAQQKSTGVLPNIDSTECIQFTLNAYDGEESEALVDCNLDKSAEQDYDRFSETIRNLKNLIREMLERKKTKQSSDGKVSSEDIFSDFKLKGLNHLIDMKSLNRLDKYRLKEARKNLFQAKDRVDQIHLQLQNLQYEVMHLQKEQKTCASFRSKDESLDLVDENSFYLSSDVPEDLKALISVSRDGKSATVNTNVATNDQLHSLHLARLNWELKQRISSEDELKLAEESRFRLEVEISAKRRTLAQFDPTLKQIIDASKPLVTQLNVPLQVYNTSNILTTYLPQPLYILYTQLCAYKGAFSVNYDVNVKGTIEEAREFEAKMKKEMNKNLNILSKDGGDDEEENGKLADEEDEEMERRSKSKKSRYHHHSSQRHSNRKADQPETEKATANETFYTKNSKLLQSHPLKVNLMFRYRQYHLTCTFTFFHKLELIGLHYSIENVSHSTSIDPRFSVISYESNIFSKLFNSKDTGCRCPNMTIVHLLKRYEIDSYLQLLPFINYSYDWAQRMAGIEYLSADERPVLSSSGILRVKPSIAIDSIDKTIKALSQRFQSRINLQEQLYELQNKKSVDTGKFESLLDSNVMFDNFNQSSLKPANSIQSFERISGETFLSEIDKFCSKKQKLIEYFGQDDDEDDDIFDQNNFIFKLSLETISTVVDDCGRLNSYLIIPLDYPEKWPFFILFFDHQSYLEANWLGSLEEHLNVRLPLKIYKQAQSIEAALYSTTLLLRQVYDLQCGFDIIIGAREKLHSKANNSLEVYSGPKCVNAFQSSSIIEGRDHSLKFES